MATEYHCKNRVLSWETLQGLAQRAGAVVAEPGRKKVPEKRELL